MTRQISGGDSERGLFGLVAIRDEPLGKPIRAARDVGQRLGNPAAGTRFGRAQREVALFHALPNSSSQICQFSIAVRHTGSLTLICTLSTGPPEPVLPATIPHSRGSQQNLDE